VYGVVAWSDPVPFAAPSVVGDVPLPGVPLAPSFVPFGLFCMTAVADLESLMDAVQDNRYRPQRGGVGGMV